MKIVLTFQISKIFIINDNTKWKRKKQKNRY